MIGFYIGFAVMWGFEMIRPTFKKLGLVFPLESVSMERGKLTENCHRWIDFE